MLQSPKSPAARELDFFLILECLLRWGWVFLERTRIFSGIQFTMHFIDFPVVEAKQFEDYTPAQPRNRR